MLKICYSIVISIPLELFLIEFYRLIYCIHSINFELPVQVSTFNDVLILFTVYFIFSYRDKWIALLHHVCDSHVWLSGKCDHEDQVDMSPIYLGLMDRRDNDYAELQKRILTRSYLKVSNTM